MVIAKGGCYAIYCLRRSISIFTCVCVIACYRITGTRCRTISVAVGMWSDVSGREPADHIVAVGIPQAVAAGSDYVSRYNTGLRTGYGITDCSAPIQVPCIASGLSEGVTRNTVKARGAEVRSPKLSGQKINLLCQLKLQ